MCRHREESPQKCFCGWRLSLIAWPHIQIELPFTIRQPAPPQLSSSSSDPPLNRPLATFARNSAASFSTVKMLPSIEEFRTWSAEQVVDFFEPLTRFSKSARESFVRGEYHGEILETLTIGDLTDDELPKGPSRGIMMVLDKIRNNRNSCK